MEGLTKHIQYTCSSNFVLVANTVIAVQEEKCFLKTGKGTNNSFCKLKFVWSSQAEHSILLYMAFNKILEWGEMHSPRSSLISWNGYVLHYQLRVFRWNFRPKRTQGIWSALNNKEISFSSLLVSEDSDKFVHNKFMTHVPKPLTQLSCVQ